MKKEDFINKIKRAENKKIFSKALKEEKPFEKSTSKVRTQGGAYDAFKRNFTANGGIIVESLGDLISFLKSENCKVGIIDDLVSNSPNISKDFDIKKSFDRSNPDEIDFAITEAKCAIAESGSILLTDSLTDDRLSTLAPLVHVAKLDKKNILLTFIEGLEAVESPYSIFVSGPSKTADVEGILIKGVHGPEKQIVWLV